MQQRGTLHDLADKYKVTQSCSPSSARSPSLRSEDAFRSRPRSYTKSSPTRSCSADRPASNRPSTRPSPSPKRSASIDSRRKRVHGDAEPSSSDCEASASSSFSQDSSSSGARSRQSSSSAASDGEIWELCCDPDSGHLLHLVGRLWSPTLSCHLAPAVSLRRNNRDI
mgnify:CR=1 FL=1